MFYFLSEFRHLFPELNIFRYITFRAGMAAVTTFLLCLVLGPWFIKILRQRKFQEIAKRHDAPSLDKFQNSKEGTPTMGGVFIIGSILLSVLLWADLSNHNVLLTFVVCLGLAVLGFIDDYVKLTGNKKKRGLSKGQKIFYQIAFGIGVGVYVCLHPDISTQVSLPFFKNFLCDLGWWYVAFAGIVVVGASNAVNLTDGLDGLAIGCVLIVSITLAALSYITGNVNFSQYLFIPYVPGTGELAVFCAAIIGASLGFLWFNCFPATVFMGDVGSLSLGGTLGVISVLIKKEILLILIGGVFVLEALSVILQVASFKTTGKRIFKMAPFHHHLQLSGWSESKIIVRFWITAIILALLTLTTLKIR